MGSGNVQPPYPTCGLARNPIGCATMSYDMIAVIKAAQARRRQILSLRRKGWTHSRIAAKFGVSRARAQALCAAAEKEAAR